MKYQTAAASIALVLAIVMSPGHIVAQNGKAQHARYAVIDLGTFGGDNGEALWINEAGDVVGYADLPGSAAHHAFLWSHGAMQDLGVPPGLECSTALSINNRRQVVGNSGQCGVGGHPFLGEEGGSSVELNMLIPAGANLTITIARFINDRGEIAGTGLLPNGDRHAVFLIPCKDGCDAYPDFQAFSQAAEVGRVALVEPSSVRERLRAHLWHNRGRD